MRSTLVAGSLRPLLPLTLLGALSLPAYAWVYPEHRDLNILAVQRLDPERRAVFDRLWSEARAGDEQRLCAAGADTGQSTTPSCVAQLIGISPTDCRPRPSPPPAKGSSPDW